MSAITEEQVVDVIKTVYDPEIPVNIYDLGLIYEIDIEDKEVSVVMTLTSPSCPAAQELPDSVESRVVEKLDEIEKCRVHIVWDPPWNPQLISAEGKKMLGMDSNDEDDGSDSGDVDSSSADSSSTDSSSGDSDSAGS